MEQLQGQIASAKIPLSRLISPALYWIMTGDDFTLDINNPDAPKVLCVGNNQMCIRDRIKCIREIGEAAERLIACAENMKRNIRQENEMRHS